MNDVAPLPKTALEIALEWSLDRPAWQRDALRRIVQAQKLNETDITELVALCKRGRVERPSESDPKPKPLDARHLPANPGAGASVSLSAIKNVRAVNNLAPEQTLSFAPNGITIVYGDNAAGKSGYARVLKRACRARHSEVIYPIFMRHPHRHPRRQLFVTASAARSRHLRPGTIPASRNRSPTQCCRPSAFSTPTALPFT
jgi:hypothetical protein